MSAEQEKVVAVDKAASSSDLDEKKAISESPPGIEAGYVEEYIPAIEGIPIHPRPTADPLDPLNFPTWQKWITLAIAMLKYFLFTYITTTTVPSFPALQEQFGISFSQVNWTVAIPALGLAVGPLIWSSLADIYGRRPIFIIGTVMASAATIGAALANNYGGYMAARFFQGLGVSPGATVGLAIVNDLFFEHERGNKIGLWVLAIDMGLLVGPLIGGFIVLVSTAWAQWLTLIFFGVLLLLEVTVMPETLYPRKLMLDKLPTQGGGDPEKAVESGRRISFAVPGKATTVDLPRTKMIKLWSIKPVPGVFHPKPWDTLIQFGKMATFPNVFIAVFFYCFGWYWWILSVITMQPVAYLQYTPQIQGVLFLGLILGTLFTELFASGALSDRIVLKLAHKNNNVREPEMRLWLIYPAILLASLGLIVWPISIDKGYHWIVGQIGFFLFGAGIQMGNTAVSSYIVDCYPEHAMSVIVFYSVLLNLSAFVNPFFIAVWWEGVAESWWKTFVPQGLIVLGVCTPVFAGLQKWGKMMREKRGKPDWVLADASE